MAGYVLATAFDEVWLQPGGNLGLLGVGVDNDLSAGRPRTAGHRAPARAAVRVQECGRSAHADRIHPRPSHCAGTAGGIRLHRGRGGDCARARRPGPGRRPRPRRRWSAPGGPGSGRPIWSTRSATATRHTQRSGPGAATSSCCSPINASHPAGVIAVMSRSSRRAARSASGRSRRGPMGRTPRGAIRWVRRCARPRPTTTFAPSRLHVDSPGGSAVASETIWREVVLLGSEAGHRRDGWGRGVGRLRRRLPGQRDLLVFPRP